MEWKDLLPNRSMRWGQDAQAQTRSGKQHAKELEEKAWKKEGRSIPSAANRSRRTTVSWCWEYASLARFLLIGHLRSKPAQEGKTHACRLA